jgi:hypothetical protein
LHWQLPVLTPAVAAPYKGEDPLWASGLQCQQEARLDCCGREGNNTKFSLQAALDLVQKHHHNDWLLSVEIYELIFHQDPKLAKEIKEHLNKLKVRRPDVSHLIDGGLELIENDLVLD